MKTNEEYFEMVRLFCRGVHGELKEKIDAGIYVRVVEPDMLVVKITKFNIEKMYIRPNISDDIMLSARDKVINDIVVWYKKEVMRMYFK